MKVEFDTEQEVGIFLKSELPTKTLNVNPIFQNFVLVVILFAHVRCPTHTADCLIAC